MAAKVVLTPAFRELNVLIHNHLKFTTRLRSEPYRAQPKQHENREETFGSAQKINMHVATLSDRIGTQCELLIPLSECRISIRTAIPSTDLCCLSDALVVGERKCVCTERAQKCALVNFN